MNKSVPGFLIDNARLICLVFLVVTGVCAWLAQDFEIDASAETLLVKDNRLYLESRLYNQRFSPEEFILVGFKPKEGGLFSEQSMMSIQALGNEILGLERVETVNAITNVPLISAANSFSADINANALSWEMNDYSQEQLKEIFTGHPVYTNLLVNESQTATAIQVVFRENEEISEIENELLSLQLQESDSLDSKESQARIEELESEKRQLSKALEQTRNSEIRRIYEITEPYREDADIYLGGNYVLAFHLVEIISSDLLIFGVAISLVISVILVCVFRNWRWLLMPLLCCAVSVIITTGLFGALGLRTTVISSNFIALQLILTLAIVIHLIVHYQHLRDEHGSLNHHDLLIRTVSEKATPCFFAGLTTSVGFAALLVSNLQPVISFGWMMIVAMITSIATSLVLFPCVLALSGSTAGNYRPAIVSRVLDKLHGFCLNRGKPILITVLLASIVMCAGIFRLEVENSFINYFSKDTRTHQELLFIDRELGGSTPLDVIYHPDDEDRESEDLVLESQRAMTLQSMQSSIEQSNAVGKVMSAVNFTRLARELNQDQPLTEYELNSMYTLLDRELRENLVGAYIDEERDEYRINARVIDSTEGLDRQQFMESLRNVFSDLGIGAGEYTLTNLFVLYQDILQRLVSSQLNTIVLVYVALWLVMAVIFRSPLVAIIALVPNVVVTIFILGLMGWMGIPLDLMTITIAAIAMGISVDDTIHFVHHFLHADSGDAGGQVKVTFHTVGYALLYTSLVIAVGFSVLGFSDFVPSIIFGLLTAVAMLVALVTDMTLLPVLLRRFVR